MANSKDVENELQTLADPAQAKNLQRFFKTGKGEYGEGDVFLGIKVPVQRGVASKFKELPLAEVKALLKSKVHEHRMVALFILVNRFEKTGEKERKEIVEVYLKNTANINNWDLIDLSAPKIIGSWLLDKDRRVLYKLAKSSSLWERRIAVLSCFMFIKHGEFKDALAIAELLLNDKHDLIHKAVGWMLREIGNKDLRVEEEFLKKHAKEMPRTMLRYAIEKFPETREKRI
ncbi:MAG: DNA alkylation repair protein [Candidatus Micrarchaeota archaeon]